MDLTTPFLSSLNLQKNSGPKWFTIEYVGLNAKCFYCGKLGHLSKACSLKLAKDSKELDYMKVGSMMKGLEESEMASPLVGDISPLSLLKEIEEVHKNFGELISLIKEGFDQGKAASLNSLQSWLLDKVETNKLKSLLGDDVLEEGEFELDLLVLALASSKLASVQTGLKEAICGLAKKK
ncbi:hypothetical protein KI387_002956, partial [Taxus chinensis]